MTVKRTDSDKRSDIERVMAYCRSAVESGRFTAGEKLPSTRALGAELAVHFLTVAAAYRRLAAEGTIVLHPGVGAFVEALAVESGFLFCMVGHQARGVRGTHTMNLAERILSHFAARGLSAELRFVGTGDGQWREFLTWLEARAHQKGVAGVWVGDMMREEVRDVCARMAPLAIPVVDVGAGSAPDAPFSVGSNMRPALRQATRDLINNGCRNLLMLCAGPREYQRPEREEAFLATCEALGVHGETMAMPVSGHGTQEGFERFGSEAVQARLAERGRRFDGLVITDDFIGRGALAALLRLGIRVPADIHICAHCRRGDSFPDVFGLPRVADGERRCGLGRCGEPVDGIGRQRVGARAPRAAWAEGSRP